MDVFSLRQHLIGDYSRFVRSFTTIGADDLRQGVEDAYASGLASDWQAMLPTSTRLCAYFIHC